MFRNYNLIYAFDWNNWVTGAQVSEIYFYSDKAKPSGKVSNKLYDNSENICGKIFFGKQLFFVFKQKKITEIFHKKVINMKKNVYFFGEKPNFLTFFCV